MAALIPICFLRTIPLYLSILATASLLALNPQTAMAADQQARSPQCRALLQALPGKVSFPATNGYTTSLQSYFSLQEAEITPYCVVSPASAQDVSTALHILGAPNSTTKFAIRGGGHTVWAGSANIEDGVTIDMRKINDVVVSPDQTVTSVGAGAIWSFVYTKLDSLGLATTGGRAAQVGVGGLTLGGASYIILLCSLPHFIKLTCFIHNQVVFPSSAPVSALYAITSSILKSSSLPARLSMLMLPQTLISGLPFVADPTISA